jgi:hypothetical protein
MSAKRTPIMSITNRQLLHDRFGYEYMRMVNQAYYLCHDTGKLIYYDSQDEYNEEILSLDKPSTVRNHIKKNYLSRKKKFNITKKTFSYRIRVTTNPEVLEKTQFMIDHILGLFLRPTYRITRDGLYQVTDIYELQDISKSYIEYDVEKQKNPAFA